MLGAYGSCLCHMGTIGKMLLAEFGCQEFTGSLLTQRVLDSVQVGIPLNALSKIHHSLGFCARAEDRAVLSAAVAC